MKHVLLKILILLVGLPGYRLVAQVFTGISSNLKLVIENSISSKNPMLIGQYFKGVPYLSNRLSKSNPEKMYYSFSDFDCVTYVENVLALLIAHITVGVLYTSLKPNLLIISFMILFLSLSSIIVLCNFLSYSYDPIINLLG